MRRKRQAEDPLDNIEALIHSICNEERREDEVSDETMPETVDLSFDPDIPDPFSNNNDQQISNSEAVSNDAWQSPAPAPVRHSSSSKKRGKVATKNKKKHVTKSNHIDYSSDQDKGSKIQKYKQSGRVTFTAGRAHRKDNHGVPATDVLETSNDEGEDKHFMENMKRLAEEKIQVGCSQTIETPSCGVPIAILNL